MKIDIHVPAFAEHPSYAGNQFLTILDQRVDRLFFVFILILCRVIERLLEVDALAAQYHGADGNSLFLFVQVGNDKTGLISPDSPGFGIPGKKLDRIFSGEKREPSVVFNRPLG